MSGALSSIVLGGIVSSSINDLLPSSSNNEFDFIDYLEKSFEKNDLNNTILKQFEEIFKWSYPESIKKDATVSLGNKDIQDLEFTNFDRVLVVMKRLLTAAKVYDLKDASGDKYKEIEESVKQVIVEILNVQDGLMTTLFNSEESTNWSDIFLSEDVSFDDIYNLFLNSGAFYDDGGIKGQMFSTLQKAYGVLDNIISTVLNIGGDISKINGGFEKLKNESNKSSDKFDEKSKEVVSEVNNSLNKNHSSLIEELKIKTNDEDPKTFSFFPILNIISGAWSLGKMFSFITFITAEAKIDSQNSIYYFEPTFKVPFVNITPLKSNVDTKITVLNEAPLKLMLPQDEEGKDIPVYEVNNQYYLNKEVAKTALINAIYLHPEQYLPCKNLITTGFGDNWELNLPPICKKDCQEEHEHITATEYQGKIAEEKEKFVQYLFDTYYETTSTLYYSDGFGEFFSTSQEAIASLQEKVDDVKNYKKVYSYRIENETIVKDTQDEIIEFIKNNQLIQEKKAINTDLIKTMIFDKINTYYDETYQVYQLMFYGEEKYFRTNLEAEKFLYNHLNWRMLNYDEIINTYQYNEWNFMSQREFDSWIEQRIVETK